MSACPASSDVDLLCYCKRIVDFKADFQRTRPKRINLASGLLQLVGAGLMIAVLKRSAFTAGKGPNGWTTPLAFMPSYFPVPATFSRVRLPSLASEKYARRLSPSTSTVSHTVDPVNFPSSEAFMPTHRKVFLSNMPSGGLLLVAVISKLDAVWFFENVIMLFAPDQQAV